MQNFRSEKSQSVSGVLFLGTAFLIWGIAPVYWKQLSHVPALEIILHRVVWSFCLMIPVMTGYRLWPEYKRVVRCRKTMAVLCGTTVILAVNWFIFIWAINHNQVLQTSLGYYINPLVNILLGMVFLKEKLNRRQSLAVFLAAAGVLILTLHYGHFPWIALALAFSFGSYGLIRKIVPVSAIAGLFVEMSLLSLPAGCYMVYLYMHGAGAFLQTGVWTDLLCMGASLVTALPLIFFTTGARLVHLKTVGFMQYIAPSCTFLLAVFVYREPLSPIALLTFILIWSALAIYSFDSVLMIRRPSGGAKRLD